MPSQLAHAIRLGSMVAVMSAVMGQASLAANIQALTAIGAQLGSAYDVDKETFPGQACVRASVIPAGVMTATFSFESALSQQQASEHLGFAAGGRARFGVTEASASARFMKNSVSSRYSVSAIWSSDYTLPSDKLSFDMTHTEIGKAAAAGSWREHCGNEYVSEIVRGAKLFFSIRVDFSSAEQKQEFEAKFNISGSLWAANASLQKASSQFSKDVKVIVSAFQLGGDVSQVTGVLGGSEQAVAGFVQCSLGNFEACGTVVGRALQYATDREKGFPSQIRPGAVPGAAPIIYRTSIYPAGYPQVNPILDTVNAQARATLHSQFEKNFAIQILIERLLTLGLSGEKLAAMTGQKQLVEANIAKIVTASRVCYDQPNNCYDAVKTMALSKIDESVLELPPLPKASFRIYTAGRGLWTRSASRDYFMNNDGSPRTPPRMLLQLGQQESASIVLYVEGDSLKEATLYFDNLKLEVIPLARRTGGFPEKYGKNYTLLVVETTRTNPGWRDIDIAKLRVDALRELKGSADNADGTFYSLLSDEYGRNVRVDIQYEQYRLSATPTPPGFRSLTVSYRNRWWDQKSEGVSTAGEGNWSVAGSIRIPRIGIP